MIMKFILEHGFKVMMITILFGLLFAYTIWLGDNAFNEGWNAGRDWKEDQVNAWLKCYNETDCLFDEDNLNISCGMEFVEMYGQEPHFRDWRYRIGG